MVKYSKEALMRLEILQNKLQEEGKCRELTLFGTCSFPSCMCVTTTEYERSTIEEELKKEMRNLGQSKNG